jgi:predicted PurR-regulated permease PerM
MTEIDEKRQQTTRTTAVTVLALIAAGWALSVSQDVLVPTVFAALLAAVCWPVVKMLTGMRMPHAVAAGIVTLTIMGMIVGAGYMLSGPVQNWTREAPDQFRAARAKLDQYRKPLDRANAAAAEIRKTVEAPSTAPATITTAVPETGVLARVFGSTAKLLSTVLEVFLIMYLMLATGELMCRKIINLPEQEPDRNRARDVLSETQSVVVRYIVLTFVINVCQATIIGLLLWWIGMPTPWLWAAGTVVLEFVPYLGAAVMITLLGMVGLATLDNGWQILAAPASYFIVTTIQNNVVSPYAYGKRLKLNPLTVLLSVLVWYLIWGVAGAFVAVPIAATMKVIADRVDALRPVGELLGE